jgi:hypothetical protein
MHCVSYADLVPFINSACMWVVVGVRCEFVYEVGDNLNAAVAGGLEQGAVHVRSKIQQLANHFHVSHPGRGGKSGSSILCNSNTVLLLF